MTPSIAAIILIISGISTIILTVSAINYMIDREKHERKKRKKIAIIDDTY